MLEKFNVVRVRFHIKEELAVTLDGKQLPLQTEKYDGMEVRQRYMVYDLGIEEEYFLYVKLPRDFACKKELQLRAGKQLIRSFKVSELRRQQRELDLFVEQTVLTKGQCYIKGWAACNEPIAIRAFGPGGKELPCEVSWHETASSRSVSGKAGICRSLPQEQNKDSHSDNVFV